MLKLTRALLKQTEEIKRRLTIYMKEQMSHKKLNDEFVIHGLSIHVVQGLLLSIDHFDDAKKDSSTDVELKVSQKELQAYLRQLSITQGVGLFLHLERLVMSSGSGQGFQRWQKAWQLNLLAWVQQ